jgi:hypothetical protein
MSKSATTKLLIAFHVVVFGAILFRIDTFPLTWVPMYSQFHGIEDLMVPVGDMPRMKRGYEVTMASGETGYVGPEELNVPNANFRRIYYERSFGVGPPKHRRERAALNPFSNWLFDQFYPDPATSIDWEVRVMDTLNRTLQRSPGEANYIVRAEAISDFATFTREQRRQGELTPAMTTHRAILTAESGP